MKIVGAVVLIVFAFLVQVSSSSAQDMLIQLKSVYGYDAWPGKAGAIKQEPSLDSMLVPGLVFIDKTPGPEGTTYRWGEAADKPRISVIVKAYSTIDDAQTGLITILSLFTSILPKTDTESLKVGDIGFLMKEGNAITFIAFVKSNITVAVKNLAPDNPVSVRDIARQIDPMM